MTGRPRRGGSSRCSTDAEKESRSACKTDTNACSSPGRTERSGRCLGLARAEPQPGRAVLHRGDHEGHVLVEVHAELLGALAHLVAVHAGREARMLQLLL